MRQPHLAIVLATIGLNTEPAAAAPSAVAAAAATAVPNSSPAPDRAGTALWIDVQPGPVALEPEGIRTAVAKELALPTLATPERPYAGKVTIVGAAGPVVIVRYESKDGTTRLERRVALPFDPARRSLVVSWIVGNLVRNEAAEILSDLASRKVTITEPETTESPSTDASTSTLAETVAAVTTPPATQKKAEPSKVLAPPPEFGRNGARSAAAKPDLGPIRAINLALFSPTLALHRDAEEHRFALSQGAIYSRIGGLNGFGLSWLVDRVDHDANGAQLAGIWSMSSTNRGVVIAGVGTQSSAELLGVEISGGVLLRKGCVTGMQLSGAWSMAGTSCRSMKHGRREFRSSMVGSQVSGGVGYLGGGFRGVQLAGITVITGGKSVGTQLSGGFALSTGEFQGVEAAGFAALATDKLAGLQLAGIVGLATAELQGAQLSGAANIGTHRLVGSQISGLFNYQGGPVSGLQLTGAANVAGDLRGAQIGLVNVGRDVDGMQLGLVNVARENHGLAIGLFNWAKNARIQPTYFYQTPTLQNVGMRTLLGPATSSVSFGYDGPKDQARTHFAVGLRTEIGRFSLGAETGYGWVLEHLSKHATDRAHELDLIGTVTMEVVPRYLSVYAGGGFAQPVSGVVALKPRGLAQAGVSVF
jgi:hypothetical protein